MSLLSQPLFSTRVRTGITRLHLVSFRLHLQATQRGTWHLAQEQLQWHLLATRNLYTIVKVLVKAAPSKILVPNVWNPSSNRYLIISPPSSSESLSAQLSASSLTALTHRSVWLKQSLRYLRTFIFSDGFLKIDISSNTFLMKKACQHDNFIDQLLRLFLQHSKMLLMMQFFKYAVTYLFDFALSLNYSRSSVLQIFFTVSRVFMIVTVAHCFVAIFSTLLESTVTGLIMCCFYACLIDHLLVSIFVGLLDCRWFITSLIWHDTSDTQALCNATWFIL